MEYPKMAQPTKIKTQSGQLYTTSQEDLQKLTKDAGLPAAPITPVGASTLGANPDSTKMTGSSAQKTASLRESIQAGNSLSEAMNRPQATKAQTAQSKQTVQASQNLAGLTSFSDRVGQIAQAKADEAVKKQVAFDPTKASNNQPLATALTKLNANPADSQALVEAANALGMTAEAVSSGQLWEALKGQFGSQVTTTAPTVNLSMFSANDWKALGFAGANDFATKLGLNPASIGSMTPDQAKQAIESFRQNKLSRADSLRALLSDPFASPADKENARAELTAMGQQGTLSAESQAKETVSSLRKAINEPKIDVEAGNKAIQEQQSKVQGTTDLFARTQQARTEQANFGSAGSFNNDIMKFLDPTYGQVGVSPSQINSPLYNDLKSGKMPQEKVSTIVATLNTLPANLRTKYLPELANMPADRLAAMIGTNPAQFQQKLEQQSFVQSLPDDASNVSGDRLAQTLGFGSEADLSKAVKDARIMQKSGLFGDMDSGLDALNKLVSFKLDGKLDLKATVKALKKSVGAGATGAAGSSLLSDMPGKLGSYSSSAAPIEKVKKQASDIFKEIEPVDLTKAFKAVRNVNLLPSSNTRPGTEAWDAAAKNKDALVADLKASQNAFKDWDKNAQKRLEKYKGLAGYDALVQQVADRKKQIEDSLKEKADFVKAQQYLFDTTAQVYTAMKGVIGDPRAQQKYDGTIAEFKQKKNDVYRQNLANKLRENPDYNKMAQTIKDYLAKYTNIKNWQAP